MCLFHLRNKHYVFNLHSKGSLVFKRNDLKIPGVRNKLLVQQISDTRYIQI